MNDYTKIIGNREKRYRAWNIRKKCITNVQSIEWLDSGSVRINSSKTEDGWQPLLNGLFDGEQVTEFILLQYTGLKDCKGVEIYVGYILDMVYAGRPKPIRGVVVQQENGMYALLDSDGEYWDFSDRYVEIIGNVFQHEHLLTQC